MQSSQLQSKTSQPQNPELMHLRNLLLQKFDKFQQAALIRTLDSLKSTGAPKGAPQYYGAGPSKRQRMGGSGAGPNDQNQKVVDEFLMRLKKMHDNGELSNQQSGRHVQSNGNGGQDDSMSHKSVPHSFNETNTVGSASHMQGSREKAAGMLRPSQMGKLGQAPTNSGSSRPSLAMRNGAGMVLDQ